MEPKQIRRLPVIDKDKRMVAMLSIGDISHSMSQQMSGEVMRSVSTHRGVSNKCRAGRVAFVPGYESAPPLDLTHQCIMKSGI